MNIDEEHVKPGAGLVLLKVCFHVKETVCFVHAWSVRGRASLAFYNGRLRIVCFGDFDWVDLGVLGKKDSLTYR